MQQNNSAIELTSPIKDEKRPAEQAHLDFNVLFHIKASVGSPMKRHTLETTSKPRRHSGVPSENGGTWGYRGGKKASRDKNQTIIKKNPLTFWCGLHESKCIFVLFCKIASIIQGYQSPGSLLNAPITKQKVRSRTPGRS